MTIITEFYKIVQTYPNAIALRSDLEGAMTYKELNERSNFIAEEICKLENDATYIGILLNRSFDMVASMIGIMKTGCGYLPLDPTYPQERIDLMLRKSQTQLVLCNSDLSKKVSSYCDTILVESISGSQEKNIDFSKEDGFACAIFSSGSTGEPNGAMMSHSSLLNTLHWVIDYYKLNQFDVDLQVPSISYTSSVEDIFSTLLSGGTLILLDEKRILNARYLYNCMEKYKVTHFIMVPSLYREFLRVINSGCSLRFIILAGEPLSRQLMNIHFSKIPHIRLVMEYGMAETCATCFVKEIIDGSSYLNIGDPILNTGFTINDPDSDGVGELFVFGDGLFSGYCNNPGMTNEKIKIYNNIKYLKTGDYVQIKDGQLVFWGRKDKQIKVNGKRVNLSEVDCILQSFDEVDDSLTLPIVYEDRQIVVSFIKTATNNLDLGKYKYRLADKLPSQFIPAQIIAVASFVCLPNKKVDINSMKNIAAKLWRQENGNNVYLQ